MAACAVRMPGTRRSAMPMKPREGESQSDFMERCVPDLMGDGKREQDQAVAACMTIWRDKDKQFSDLDVPYPDDDESKDDFLDRCVMQVLDDDDSFASENDALEACELAWEERRAPASARRANGSVRHKTHAETVQGMEFVLSDETPDRMGDVVMANGWDLENFNKNPIALFNHSSSFPIGRWHNLRADKGALRGHLELAPKGTSDRIDEIRALVDAGILRAVSVGFRPIESKPRKSADNGYGGEVFTKQELVETSLVSVPANPNALAVAKSLKISAETLDLVFAEQGNRRRERRRRGVTGEQAETSRNRKGSVMPLAQRIKDAEGRIVALRDKLTEHLKSVDDTNVTDAQLETTNELNAKITQEEKGLAALRAAEKNLALSSEEDREEQQQLLPATVLHRQEPARSSARPFAMPNKKFDPVELIIRDAIVKAFAHINRTSLEETRQKLAVMYPRYGEDLTKAYIE